MSVMLAFFSGQMELLLTHSESSLQPTPQTASGSSLTAPSTRCGSRTWTLCWTTTRSCVWWAARSSRCPTSWASSLRPWISHKLRWVRHRAALSWPSTDRAVSQCLLSMGGGFWWVRHRAALSWPSTDRAVSQCLLSMGGGFRWVRHRAALSCPSTDRAVSQCLLSMGGGFHWVRRHAALSWPSTGRAVSQCLLSMGGGFRWVRHHAALSCPSTDRAVSQCLLSVRGGFWWVRHRAALSCPGTDRAVSQCLLFMCSWFMCRNFCNPAVNGDVGLNLGCWSAKKLLTSWTQGMCWYVASLRAVYLHCLCC